MRRFMWVGLVFLFIFLGGEAFSKGPKKKKIDPRTVYHLRLYAPGLVFDSEVYFEYGKKTLRPASMANLDVLVKWLQEDTSTSFEIRGHCEERPGLDEYSHKITQDQAEEIRDYLVVKGIDTKRLSYKGYQADCPVDSNKTEKGRANNRRMDVVILKEGLSGCLPPFYKEPGSKPSP